ncbi:regulator of microtubule dynamics protein 1-like [Mya arenaria]|uniref:regulator of microtubule dynamics protein 1-like n=1 Tax=Mya arenaria TaxID=6604 RepID=UPI0022E763BD|nr:regulator of microtubule dynamics protein 1-like [Mya arenaria]
MATNRLGFFFERQFQRLYQLRNGCQSWRQALKHGRPSAVRRICQPLAVTAPTLSLFGISWGGSKPKEGAPEPVKGETVQDQKTILLERADRLYSEHKIDELYDLLIEHKDSRDDEILWRLARAAVDQGKLSDNKEILQKKYYEAFEFIKQALEINNQNYAVHKWYAILLDYTGEFEGKKQRIKNAFQVKEHFMKAVELNPKDATSIHSLGYWCFTMADLKWYERTVASALFATPPSSTYDEALQYFLKAEEAEPNFYSMNLLMLGKTYLKLQDGKMAYQYLSRCRDYPMNTPDDRRANAEAKQLLAMLTSGAGRKTRD